MIALLIIDLQQASLADSDKHDVEGVVERINHLATFVRKSGGKVIFIQHDGDEALNLVPGTPGWQLLPSLQVDESDLKISKTTNDAFYQTDLAGQLETFGIGKLVICGWATDQCVDSTVRAAVSREFEVVVAADCHTVSDRPVITAQQVIGHHNGIWAHMVTPGEPVRVLPAKEIEKQILQL